MDIIFVRHGRTSINQQGRYGGVLDTDISDAGIAEIKRLTGRLKGTAFDGVYTSPLRRAIRTVELLAGDYRIDERLKEMNFGVLEGLTYEEICERYPEESHKWARDFVHYRLPDGESVRDVYERTKAFVRAVKDKHDNVLAVTHGGVIRCALSLVFDNIEFFYKFKIDHGSITVVSIEKDFMYIKSMNGVY